MILMFNATAALMTGIDIAIFNVFKRDACAEKLQLPVPQAMPELSTAKLSETC